LGGSARLTKVLVLVGEEVAAFEPDGRTLAHGQGNAPADLAAEALLHIAVVLSGTGLHPRLEGTAVLKRAVPGNR